MTQELRVGIVGCVSSYSLYYARIFAEMPGVALGGAAHLGRSPKQIEEAWNLPWLGKEPNTLEEYAARYNVRLYEQPEELIEAENLDAVCITTEDYLRTHHALRAIARGMHVFVPKPFASSRADAERMFDAANAQDVVLLGSLPLRFSDAYIAANAAIDEGAIGRPLSGRLHITHHLTLGGWKSDPTQAAGPEYEMGFYVFDVLCWYMKSAVKTVTALGANLDHQGIPFIDNGKCLVEFENGALGSVDLYFSVDHAFPGRSVEIIGDEGALRLASDFETGQLYLEIYTRAGKERRAVDAGDMHYQEQKHWIDMCRSGADPTAWQQEALHTLDLCSAFKEAYQTGARVHWPAAVQSEVLA